MTVDMRLANKGRSEPIRGLAQQGRVHVALAKQYATELDDAGWSASDTAAFEKDVESLEAMIGSRSLEREGATDATQKESSAVDDAKAFLRRLRNALPRALRKKGPSAVRAESFEVGETLGRSTPKISAFLANAPLSLECGTRNGRAWGATRARLLS